MLADEASRYQDGGHDYRPTPEFAGLGPRTSRPRARCCGRSRTVGVCQLNTALHRIALAQARCHPEPENYSSDARTTAMAAWKHFVCSNDTSHDATHEAGCGRRCCLITVRVFGDHGARARHKRLLHALPAAPRFPLQSEAAATMAANPMPKLSTAGTTSLSSCEGNRQLTAKPVGSRSHARRCCNRRTPVRHAYPPNRDPYTGWSRSSRPSPDS